MTVLEFERTMLNAQQRALDAAFVRGRELMAAGKLPIELSCRIPDDWIDTKRYALFMARSVMSELIEQLKAPSTDSNSSAP